MLMTPPEAVTAAPGWATTVAAAGHAATGQPAAGGSEAVGFEHVRLAFDDQVVLEDVSFSLARGTMTVLLGPSGSGKSVLLKLILGLLRPDSGVVCVDGQPIEHLSERDLMPVRAGIGIMFQENALFDSLTVADNVGYRLVEELRQPDDQVARRVGEVLSFVGLAEYARRLPSELSGGQRRRVAIARAMAAAPRLLLFDDPTSGLDPITATSVDDEIVKLRDIEAVTAVVVTHQMRDAFYIAGHRATRTATGVVIAPAAGLDRCQARFLLLSDGRIRFDGSAAELEATTDPYLRKFMFMTRPPW